MPVRIFFLTSAMRHPCARTREKEAFQKVAFTFTPHPESPLYRGFERGRHRAEGAERFHLSFTLPRWGVKLPSQKYFYNPVACCVKARWRQITGQMWRNPFKQGNCDGEGKFCFFARGARTRENILMRMHKTAANDLPDSLRCEKTVSAFAKTVSAFTKNAHRFSASDPTPKSFT